jgi:hypothetical protein
MPERPRFRIMDLIVLIAASAVAAGAVVALDRMSEADQGKVAFWLVFVGFALVGYLAVRFGGTAGIRLIVLGIALAFAGAADALFLDGYMDAPTAAVVACIGLTMASLVLLVGGVILVLRDPGKLPVVSAPKVDGKVVPHPLDVEEMSPAPR